jgi:hypothetical protein
MTGGTQVPPFFCLSGVEQKEVDRIIRGQYIHNRQGLAIMRYLENRPRQNACKRFGLIIIYGLFLSIPAVPTSFAAKYAGDPFSLGVGARALALGGAVVAGPFDGTAAYWNPAGMTQLSGRYLVAMHAETFGSLLNHDFVGFTSAAPDGARLIQAFGFYVYYLGGGGIKITEMGENGRPYVLREESHADMLFAGAVAGRISSTVDYGLTARVIYRDLATESGFGLSADAGLIWQAKPYANIGVMVTDITTGLIHYSGKTFGRVNTESIYPTVKPGLMLTRNYREFTGRFLMSGDVKFENLKNGAQYWSGPLSLDMHYGLEVGYRDMLFGRAGFDIGRFTTGVGLSVRNLTFDFAYLHHDRLDETFRISAGYRF